MARFLQTSLPLIYLFKIQNLKTMKKVLVFCVAFMFVAINVCSAQTDRVEKKPSDATVQPAATDVQQPATRDVTTRPEVTPATGNAAPTTRTAEETQTPSATGTANQQEIRRQEAEPRKQEVEPRKEQ